MKPGQIRPLYLEPRLHKQSVKQEINNHRTCLAKPLHTLKKQKNVWRTIGPPSMRLLSDLPKICPLWSDGPMNIKNSEGMLSGSAQKMLRERLREIKIKKKRKGMTSRTRTSKPTIVVGIKSSFY
jgi:hypothetical protein